MISKKQNDTHRLCFLHLPKTAGTTLNHILHSHYHPSDICYIPPWLKFRRSPPDLTRYKLLYGHTFYEIFNVLPNKPTLITMLRDPIERAISQYEQMKRTPVDPFGKRDWPRKDIADMTFDEFIRDEDTSQSIRNVQTRFIGAQFDRKIVTVDDAIAAHEQVNALDIELAKERLREFDVVGIAEQFAASLQLISYVMDWFPIQLYQNMNVSPHRLTRDEIAPHTLATLIALNELDLTLYQYAQQLFQAQYDQMVYNLLELNHREQFISQYPEPFECVEIDPYAPMFASGWFRGEHNESLAWRWSGPETISTLFFPLVQKADQTELRLEIWLAHVSAIDVLASLNAEINEQPLELMQSADESGLVHFQGTLTLSSSANVSHYNALTFRINRTVPASEIVPRSTDPRSLGLAFSKIRISAV